MRPSLAEISICLIALVFITVVIYISGHMDDEALIIRRCNEIRKEMESAQ